MMKPPGSTLMETIWHGAKSLAHKLEAECFGSTKPSSIEMSKVAILCARIYEKVMRPNILAPKHYLEAPSFACHLKF